MTQSIAGPRPLLTESDLISQTTDLPAGVGVTRIEDPADMQMWVTQQVSGTRRELCSVLPAGPYSLDTFRSSWDQDKALLDRGVNAMAIYQAEAVRTPAILRYLSELAGVGAQIRVTRALDHRMIICDRRTAFVAVQPGTLALPYLMISEPALVRSFCDQFANGWRVAHSVGFAPEDVLEHEKVREILRILASGITDEHAARLLGVSDRTIRRRVAAVLDLLGASSRFEAGVKAVEAGWL